MWLLGRMTDLTGRFHVLLWVFISIVHKNVISIHSLLKNEPRNGIMHPISLEKKANRYGNVLQEALETADRPRHDAG